MLINNNKQTKNTPTYRHIYIYTYMKLTSTLSQSTEYKQKTHRKLHTDQKHEK